MRSTVSALPPHAQWRRAQFWVVWGTGMQHHHGVPMLAPGVSGASWRLAMLPTATPMGAEAAISIVCSSNVSAAADAWCCVSQPGRQPISGSDNASVRLMQLCFSRPVYRWRVEGLTACRDAANTPRLSDSAHLVCTSGSEFPPSVGLLRRAVPTHRRRAVRDDATTATWANT